RGEAGVSLPAHRARSALAARRPRAGGERAALRRDGERARIRRHAAAVGSVDLPLLVVLTTRVLLIANPASRRGKRLIGRAEAAIVATGATCEVVRTERSGHAAEIARARGAEFDRVLTLGGDGTAMEVAGALAFGPTPIGVLAGGTGNLLARALGIPMRVERAVPALLDGQQRRIDLGVVLGHHFAVAAGVGIDAAMVEETPVWLKRRLGVLAYTLIATRTALRGGAVRQLRRDPGEPDLLRPRDRRGRRDARLLRLLAQEPPRRDADHV